MTYVEQQLVAHKDHIWYLPAIALSDFSIIVLPSSEVFKGVDPYQILHSKTGMFLITFSVAEVAIECLKELQRRSLLIDIPGDPPRMDYTTREVLWEIVVKYREKEEEHPDFLRKKKRKQTMPSLEKFKFRSRQNTVRRHNATSQN